MTAKSRWIWICLAGIAVLLGFTLILDGFMGHNKVADFATVEPAEFEAALEATALSSGYVAANSHKMARAEDLFDRVFAGAVDPDLQKGFQRLGFELTQVRIGGEVAFFVREAPDHGEGKGAYLVRRSGRSALIQAPHRFKDLDSGKIAAQLVQENDVRAAAWNTVPRSYTVDGATVSADLAHIAVSYFNAFATAFARHYPGGRVVQLHGFAQEKRTTEAGRTASAIISAGTKTPTDMARGVAECLAKALLGETVLLYPEQVQELGGTTNDNAKALRAIGFEHFLHVELSRELRRTLAGDVEARRALATSLMDC